MPLNIHIHRNTKSGIEKIQIIMEIIMKNIDKKFIIIFTWYSIQIKAAVVFNPFPHDRSLDQTKLKAFADDKLNITKIIISVFDRVENMVGKGEIACTSNFSFFLNVFQRLLSQTRQKVSLCGNELISVLQYTVMYQTL